MLRAAGRLDIVAKSISLAGPKQKREVPSAERDVSAAERAVRQPKVSQPRVEVAHRVDTLGSKRHALSWRDIEGS